MASHDIGQTRGGKFDDDSDDNDYDDFDDQNDDGDGVDDNHEMMLCYTGFGANIKPGLPWYGVHQCSASKNSL